MELDQPNELGLKIDEKMGQDMPALSGDFMGYENRYLWGLTY